MEWYYIAMIVAGVILLAGIFTLILLKKKNVTASEEFPDLLLALGGKDNVNEVTFKGSRVSALLIDKKIIDKDKMKEHGVETIVVANKKVTMVVGKKSEVIFNYLNNQINK